jgi:predicted porin
MKKSLIALAALAAVSGAAQAQSSITIYGILDAGYSSKDSDTTKYSASTNTNTMTKTKTSGIAGNGAESTSRLGFRGTEDLGGGLKANFVFETALNPAESTLSAFNNRQAFVGLEGGFGTITAGTVYSAAHSLAAGFSASTLPNVVGDVMYVQSGGSLGGAMSTYGITTTGASVAGTAGDTVGELRAALVTAKLATTGNATGYTVAGASAGVASNAAAVTAVQALLDAKATADLNARLARVSNISYNVRTNNTITYMSPNMSGFKVGAQYSLPAQTKLTGGDETTSSATQLSVNYAAGKFAAAAVHTTGESKSITTSSSAVAGASTLLAQSIANAAGAAVTASQASSLAVTASTTTVEVKTKESIAALSYDLGVAKVSYIYAKRDAKDTVSDLNEKTTHSFGVKAPFGKATAFAIYSMGDTKVLNGTANAAKFDLDGTQVGVSYAMSKRSDIYAIYGTNKMDNTANSNDIKDKQYAIGLRHQF